MKKKAVQTVVRSIVAVAFAATVAVGAVHAQAPAGSVATLIQTIDLGAWTGTPVQASFFPLPQTFINDPRVIQVPQPAPGTSFSITGIAIDPAINTLYVVDHASSNIYQVDTTSNTVTTAVYTYGIMGNLDGVPASGSPVAYTVIADPSTHRWLFMGGDGGGIFNGTTLAEGVATQSMQFGGALDPVNGDIIGGSGMPSLMYVTNGLKFLNFALEPCNTVTINPLTQYSWASCILDYGSTSTLATANYGIIGFNDGDPNMQARIGRGTPYPASWATLQHAHAQPRALAINPNTNRLYAAAAMSPTTLDVIDASTNTLVASIPGLADESNLTLSSSEPLPHQIAINTVTNTIFVVNSDSSTISIFDGNTNTLADTISVPVPDGAVVSVQYPVSPWLWLQDIKTGNTVVDSAAGTARSLGGVVGVAVNELTNTLYAVTVNGMVYVYALNPGTAPTTFSATGTIKNLTGGAMAGVTVTATGATGSATALTDPLGRFVLTGLTDGSYTIQPAAAGVSFDAQPLVVADQNISGLAFQAHPPIMPATVTLSPWTMIGPGVVTTATVTLNQPAAASGTIVSLVSSNGKAAKVPATVTVAAHQMSASFQVQGSGVSAATAVTITASSNGGAASALVTVAPSDSLKITGATYSKSKTLLQVTATGTNAAATIQVQNANTNAIMGTMTNLGSGNFSFQLSLASGVPTSVNIISNLGGKTGQGISLIP